MEVIIDIQGFKKAFNEFVPKELAITYMESETSDKAQNLCVIFDEPFPMAELSGKYRRINTWLSENYHGIPWDAVGDKPYEDAPAVLKEMLAGVMRIYVKGVEKKDWLRKLIGSSYPLIENLEDLGCPKLDDVTDGEICYQHRHHAPKGTRKNYHCALRNVVHLKCWFAKYRSGCIEKSLKTFCDIRDLNLMSPEDIKFLPRYFILDFACDNIDDAWDMLPASLQKDPAIMGYRRCKEHCASTSGDQPDRRPPFVKDCALCQLFHQ